MVYGVVTTHDADDYNKMKIQIWRSNNANLLFNKGCEAVFICEPDAKSYACEQSKIRQVALDLNVIDVV